jgi:hypothetical protein
MAIAWCIVLHAPAHVVELGLTEKALQIGRDASEIRVIWSRSFVGRRCRRTGREVRRN